MFTRLFLSLISIFLLSMGVYLIATDQTVVDEHFHGEGGIQYNSLNGYFVFLLGLVFGLLVLYIVRKKK